MLKVCPLTLNLGSLLAGLGWESLGVPGVDLHWPHIRQSLAIQCVSSIGSSAYRDRLVISGGALRTEAGRGGHAEAKVRKLICGVGLTSLDCIDKC